MSKRGRPPVEEQSEEVRALRTHVADQRRRLEFLDSTFLRAIDGSGSLVSLRALVPFDVLELRARRIPVLGPGSGIEVRLSAIPNAGQGLFATRRFAKGEIVTFYDGPIVFADPPATLTREQRSHLRVLYPLTFAIDGNAPQARKGEPGTGGAALINDAHPGSRRDNNVELTSLDTTSETDRVESFTGLIHAADPRRRIVIARALRDIAAGEEFLVDYGPTYWKVVPDPPPERRRQLRYVDVDLSPGATTTQRSTTGGEPRRRMAPTPISMDA